MITLHQRFIVFYFNNISVHDFDYSKATGPSAVTDIILQKSAFNNWLFSALGCPINGVKKRKCSQSHCESTWQPSQQQDRFQMPPKRRENVLSSATTKRTEIIIQVISIDFLDFLQYNYPGWLSLSTTSLWLLIPSALAHQVLGMYFL